MIRSHLKILLSLTVVAGLGGLVGCEDWESGDSFNTSQGAGAFINWSGVYRPRSGAFLVGSNITQIVLTQVGNSLEVSDSNGSYYQGSVGSPGIVAGPDAISGQYPAGATMLQGQISFSGQNAVTKRNVNFVGVIHAVAVDDVQGVSSTTSSGVQSDNNLTVNVTTNSGGASVVIDKVTNTTYSAQTDVTHDYTLTEANTQYVLSGQWVEETDVFAVEGIAAGLSGTFTTISQP